MAINRRSAGNDITESPNIRAKAMNNNTWSPTSGDMKIIKGSMPAIAMQSLAMNVQAVIEELPQAEQDERTTIKQSNKVSIEGSQIGEQKKTTNK